MLSLFCLQNEEGFGHDISSAGKKFINYEFFTPALFFEDLDGANNKAILCLKNIESLLFLVSKDPCSDDDLCCAFQWDGNQCLILLRDVSTKDIIGPAVLHEDAEVQTVRTIKTTTTQHSTEGDDGRRGNDKIILLEGSMVGSLCNDSISLDEKKVILHNMKRRFLRAAMISLTPAAAPEHSNMNIVEVENRGKILDRFGASIIDDSSKISLNNDSFMLLRDDDSGREFSVSRSFEPGSTIKTSRDNCKLNGVGDRNNRSEVEGSGGLLSHKKKGGKAINFFFPLGRKLSMHFLMVVVLIFVQSPDNFALGKEIEVDEEGSLVEVVDLTIQNERRNFVSSVLAI